MNAVHPLFRAAAAYADEARAAAYPHILCVVEASPDGEAAFLHALRIALAGPSKLTLLHVGAEPPDRSLWSRLPGVRETLVRWGHIEPEVDKAEVAERVGIVVTKFAVRDEDLAAAVSEFAMRQPTHLVVMATSDDSRRRLIRSGSAELRVLRQAKVPMLILPRGAAGFVNPQTGQTRLRDLLVPVDHQPDARTTLALAGTLCEDLAEGMVEARALYAGSVDAVPRYLLSSTPSCHWDWQLTDADLLEAVEAQPADLIAVPTAGPDGLRERFTGSTFDRLLARLRCPVLAVPAAEPGAEHPAEE